MVPPAYRRKILLRELINPARTRSRAMEWEVYSPERLQDDLFDVKGLLSSWTTLSADEFYDSDLVNTLWIN
jgi:hypothetical protein